MRSSAACMCGSQRGGMMAITMTFLGLSTVGLLIATWVQFIKPAISG